MLLEGLLDPSVPSCGLLRLIVAALVSRRQHIRHLGRLDRASHDRVSERHRVRRGFGDRCRPKLRRETEPLDNQVTEELSNDAGPVTQQLGQPPLVVQLDLEVGMAFALCGKLINNLGPLRQRGDPNHQPNNPDRPFPPGVVLDRLC